MLPKETTKADIVRAIVGLTGQPCNPRNRETAFAVLTRLASQHGIAEPLALLQTAEGQPAETSASPVPAEAALTTASLEATPTPALQIPNWHIGTLGETWRDQHEHESAKGRNEPKVHNVLHAGFNLGVVARPTPTLEASASAGQPSALRGPDSVRKDPIDLPADMAPFVNNDEGRTKLVLVAPSGSTHRVATREYRAILMLAKGTTQSDLMTAFDWEPHTARGLIHGAIKKRYGFTVSAVKYGKGKGSYTIYKINEPVVVQEVAV